MIPDLDIYRAANVLVERHGEDAPMEMDRAPLIHSEELCGSWPKRLGWGPWRPVWKIGRGDRDHGTRS